MPMAPMGPLTPAGALAWSPEPVFLAGCLAALASYGAAVAVLCRRGDRWPAGRCAAWAAGVGVVGAATCTGLHRYAMAMFSAHMVQHLLLGLIAPVLLLLGAPSTLALRVLPQRLGRYAGPRVWLLRLVHSRYARTVSSPLLTIPLFALGLYGTFFTPAFDLAMDTRAGQIVMAVHLVAAGHLFYWPIIGVDPGPNRPGYVQRVLLLLTAMPVHAFFGLAVMQAREPVVAAFTQPPASWHLDPLADQRVAGALTWALTAVPTLLVLLVIWRQWEASEVRAARRADRAGERGRDRELEAYNAMLARLHVRAQR
ncbi:cytochrome c oxidase assembly protein [Kitasatospora cineracea]|nr:cytochrome c oxidase assembly protein [Kitasatospora cineracea]